MTGARANDGSPSISLRETASFFRSGISRVNTYRLRMNNTKNLVKYVTKDTCTFFAPSNLDKPAGYLSFTLYQARLCLNTYLLVNHFISPDANPLPKDRSKEDIYYELLNDLLWSTCNLLQFFWFNSKTSRQFGIIGIEMEMVAQLVDLVVMLVRFKQAHQAYQHKRSHASAFEREKMDIEWKYRVINIVRSSLHMMLIVGLLGVLALTPLSIPFSPIVFTISILSNFLRIMLAEYKNKELLGVYEIHARPFAEKEKAVKDMELQMNKTKLEFAVFYCALPLGIYLLAVAPMTISIPSLILLMGAFAVISSQNSACLKNPNEVCSKGDLSELASFSAQIS